jgi:hypothetical protein
MRMDGTEKRILNYLKLTKIYKRQAELYDLTQEQLDKIFAKAKKCSRNQ